MSRIGRWATPAILVAVLLASSLGPLLHAQNPAGQPEEELLGRAPVRDPERRFRKFAKSWKQLKQQNVVMQQRDFSCGAAALATLLKYYWGDDITETRILRELDQLLTREETLDRIENGLTLTDLRKVAVQMGYQATIGTLEIDKLGESKVPLIVGIEIREYRHFVVYRGMDDRDVYLADPARGNVRTPIAEFAEQWQENAILAVAKPGSDIRETSPLSVRESEKQEIGRLNRQTVRKNYLPAPRFFPLAPTR